MGYGGRSGWTSPTIPILQSQDTPLKSGALSDDQISWIGSLLCVGGLLGTFLFGWICDKYGRKFSVSCMAIPQLVSKNYEHEIDLNSLTSTGKLDSDPDRR